ncbi:nucleotide kinase domain-containing protein [Streptomyces sp. NBC_01244]|uniref:nucleotide kinase domain-containing protein n=1 Tax=Streptomyces sp. NBC_01244 TaxID=2903797 RepID=UPI002E149557|nr:putative DNA base hypermodification protein [Streptomyces sp. NBC_01244]
MVMLLQDRQTSGPAETAPRVVRVSGRVLQPTPVFDTYWRFASARQEVYEGRLVGRPQPWTHDPILSQYRFTNCYRAADRVSQTLIADVIYQGSQEWEEVFFRTLLFKVFNKESTWQLLTRELGEVRWDVYDYGAYDRVLSGAFAKSQRLYSAAYIVPPPQLGERRKHLNHLRLLEMMMATRAAERVLGAATMREVYEVLLSYPALGPFLAYQFTIDLNYASEMPFSEMDFVMPGPGARDGIRKCFGRSADGIEADVIRYMADSQQEHFTRLGLPFDGLKGRPLQLIDCQNLFCEVDKYARVAHPEIAGISGRSRIKQSYRHDVAPLRAWFPPKWGLVG